MLSICPSVAVSDQILHIHEACGKKIEEEINISFPRPRIVWGLVGTSASSISTFLASLKIIRLQCISHNPRIHILLLIEMFNHIENDLLL
ncbi:hypothetical protein DRO35_02210 [Candidatus Bathyarchaeota archaeon]|nr:MAG: hypothetical protein DRO35_02210 [Candidatus Bathyarchaeota archaeon]